jgi:hypothetical protein
LDPGLNLYSNTTTNVSASGALTLNAGAAAILNGATVGIAPPEPPSVTAPPFTITTPTFNVADVKMPEPVSMSVSLPRGQKYSSGSAAGVTSALCRNKVRRK